MNAPIHRVEHPPSVLTVRLGLGVLCAIWGSTWLVIQKGLEDLPPLGSAGLRFLLASVVMALVARLLQRREGGAHPAAWLTWTLGLTNFAGSYALVYWAETKLASGLVSLLWAVFPMMQGVVGPLFVPEERLGRGQWVGIFVGFAGVVLLFSTDLRYLGSDAALTALALLGSPLLSAVGASVIKRHGRHTSSLLLNRNSMAVGGAALLLSSLALEGDARVAWTRQAILSLAYLSIVGTVASFGIYFWLLRYAPAYKLALIAYVVPVIALLLGSLLHGEPFTSTMLLGAVLILGGVGVVARRRSPAVRSQPGDEVNLTRS